MKLVEFLVLWADKAFAIFSVTGHKSSTPPACKRGSSLWHKIQRATFECAGAVHWNAGKWKHLVVLDLVKCSVQNKKSFYLVVADKIWCSDMILMYFRLSNMWGGVDIQRTFRLFKGTDEKHEHRIFLCSSSSHSKLMIVWVPDRFRIQAIQQLQSKTTPQQLAVPTAPITHSAPMDIFQRLITDLDTEGRYLFLNAVANQLRYPNNHTHYFSCVLLYLFAEANLVSSSYCTSSNRSLLQARIRGGHLLLICDEDGFKLFPNIC